MTTQSNTDINWSHGELAELLNRIPNELASDIAYEAGLIGALSLDLKPRQSLIEIDCNDYNKQPGIGLPTAARDRFSKGWDCRFYISMDSEKTSVLEYLSQITELIEASEWPFIKQGITVRCDDSGLVAENDTGTRLTLRPAVDHVDSVKALITILEAGGLHDMVIHHRSITLESGTVLSGHVESREHLQLALETMLKTGHEAVQVALKNAASRFLQGQMKAVDELSDMPY